VSEFLQHSQRILPVLLEGMGMTLFLTAVSGLLGTVLGALTALARIARNKVLVVVASGYVTLFRGTPLLLQILFFWGVMGQVLPKAPGYVFVIFALALNAGAYIAEIIRAAIQSIDKGQMEAARSVGMSYGMAMRRIVFPQTFRRLLPPMVNEAAALTKETSLAMAVGVLEMMKYSQQFVSRTGNIASTYIWTAAGYLIVTVALTSLATHLEKKLEARG